MAEDEAALIDFVSGVDWEKHDEPEVLELLTKIKQRVEELDDGEDEEETNRRGKVVVVGDGGVGKTCLFITHATGNFPETYVPTVFENYTYESPHKGEPFLLHMWDTAGQEDYDRLRPLSYPGTDVVLLCFSLVNESTFESIREKWNPEINHYLDGIPKILVGTKHDMREGKICDSALAEYEEITTKEGQELADEIGAIAYIESSPKTLHNLPQVFEAVVEACLERRNQEQEPSEKKSKSKSKSKSSKSKKTKDDGEKKEKKKKSKSSKSKTGETEEEKKERRKKRKEEKEGKKEKKKKSKSGGEKKEKKKKSKTDSDGDKKSKKKKKNGL